MKNAALLYLALCYVNHSAYYTLCKPAMQPSISGNRGNQGFYCIYAGGSDKSHAGKTRNADPLPLHAGTVHKTARKKMRNHTVPHFKSCLNQESIFFARAPIILASARPFVLPVTIPMTLPMSFTDEAPVSAIAS